MKTRLIFILLSLCLCGISHAETYRDYFYRGNIAYEKGDYKEAVKEYDVFLNQGVESGNVYYNLGNAYYKMGNVGKAILYYEKALKLMPGDADTAANLAFVRTNIEDKPEEVYRGWFLKRLDFFFSGISLDGLTLLCAAFFWISLILGALYLFIRDRWLNGWRYSAGAGAIFAIILALLFVRVYAFENVNYGIVTDKEAEVRYGPAESDSAAFTIHEGSKVRIENKTQDWYQIYFSPGKGGWVRKVTVDVI